MDKYWLTPYDIYEKLNNEFNFDFDPCPYPLPDGFNSLDTDWGKSNYVNPPFRKHDGGGFGPTAWVRKAIEQKNKGRGSVLLIPTQSYVNLLLEAGAELRSMGRVRWLEAETKEPCKSPSPITCFILRPTFQLSTLAELKGGVKWVKASERLPETEKIYITKDKDGEVKEFYFKQKSPTHWHYLDMTRKGATENVCMHGHIAYWVDESPSPTDEGQPAQGGKPFMEGKDEK